MENEKNSLRFDEKSILFDMLLTQKYMSGAYCNAALESSDVQLKNTFLSIQEDEQLAENELFAEIQKRSIYSVKDAPKNDVKTLKDKFSNAL